MTAHRRRWAGRRTRGVAGIRFGFTNAPAAASPAARPTAAVLMSAVLMTTVLVGGGFAAAGAAVALSGAATPEISESPDAPETPGPRPVDPDTTCVSSGNDIVALPSAQVRLAAERGWQLSRGAGITVAVLDSGVDPTPPQLSGRVDAGFDAALLGYTGDADCLGEGTAMAGLVAADQVDGIGFHGVAPDARILPVRVVEDDLSATPEALAAGLRGAVAAGAEVVLVTVGAPVTSPDLAAALAEAAAADVLVVAAAELPTAGASGYAAPAPYTSVLAVGAVEADGSAMLQESDTPPIVDLAAPGTGVVGTLPRGGHTDAYTGARPAAAYVAGVAALVRAEFPALTAAQVRTRLQLTADHPGTQVPDPLVGWGVVNAEAALSDIIPAEAVGAPATVTPSGVVVAPPRAADAIDTTAVDRSRWIFSGAALLAVAGLVALAVVPRGRRAGWRPTRSAGNPLRRDTGTGHVS